MSDSWRALVEFWDGPLGEWASGAVLVVVALLLALGGARRRRADLLAEPILGLARGYGLELEEDVAAGEVRGVPVRITVTGRDTTERSLWLTNPYLWPVGIPVVLSAELWRLRRLRAETGSVRMSLEVSVRLPVPEFCGARVPHGDVPTDRPLSGDPDFDERVLLSGPEKLWVAALAPTARVALGNLLSDGVEIRDGALRRRFVDAHPWIVAEAIEHLVSVAKLLRGHPRQAALRDALADSKPGVRARALRHLWLHGRDRLDGTSRDVDALLDATLAAADVPVTPDALADALAHPEPDVVTAAVIRLHDRGSGRHVEALRALDPSGADALVSAAIGAIRHRAGPATAGRVTLATPTDGGLSVPAADKGAVSVAGCAG